MKLVPILATVLVLINSTPGEAESAYLAVHIETYSCQNPLSYRKIETAAGQSYRAAHEAAEAARAHGCEKREWYEPRRSFVLHSVRFIGLVQRSHLEVRFVSSVLVKST